MAARKNTHQPKLVDYQDRLRAAGLRSTSPRVAVLRELDSATAPRSHADLVEALGEEGYDRVTIYRNLTDLTEAGLVMRADLGDHVWRFELRRGNGAGNGNSHNGTHPHFTCTDCGSVACLPAESVRITPARGAPRSVSARSVDIQLRGLCDRCV